MDSCPIFFQHKLRHLVSHVFRAKCVTSFVTLLFISNHLRFANSNPLDAKQDISASFSIFFQHFKYCASCVSVHYMHANFARLRVSFLSALFLNPPWTFFQRCWRPVLVAMCSQTLVIALRFSIVNSARQKFKCDKLLSK